MPTNTSTALIGDNTIAAGYGLSTLGSMYSTYQASKTRGIIDEHNAIMAGYDARYEGLKADIRERILRDEEARVVGTARTYAGASGFATDEGSNFDVVSGIHQQFAYDVAAIRLEGLYGEGKFESAAANFRLAAKAEESAGKQEVVSTALQASTDIARFF